ncbi:MAG: transketolase [Fusobacteriaceae bacterium]|jgi:transketolase|nr:transketolase [Fusobacteriaceae bacterium]
MNIQYETAEALQKFADRIRYCAIKSMYAAGGGHAGGVLSLCELMAVLYGSVMNYDPANPRDVHADKVVLSKGHCGPVLYAALALSGFFPVSELDTLNKNGGRLPSHCDMNKTPGVDMTTGSLGQGASTAAGMALGKKLQRRKGNVFLVLGDGELNEGQVWEMAMFANQHKLDNLITYIDWNHQQLDGYADAICHMGDIAAKFAAFGFEASAIDGHDPALIREKTLRVLSEKNGVPKCIVLDTVKGKGWSVTEGRTGIHHIAIDAEMMAAAEAEFTGKVN